MSGTSYIQRRIDLTFKLAQGTFARSGTNTMTVSGLRVITTITRLGSAAMNQMAASIFGLPLDVMNDLTTMGKIIGDNKWNQVGVYAGDSKSTPTLIFSGTVHDAWANFGGMPNVSFDIAGFTGGADAISAVPPSSYQSGADVGTIIEAISGQMNPPRNFVNNGVNVKLQNAYYPGSPRQQLQEVAQDSGIFWEDDGQTVTIWPPGGSKGGAVPLVSPSTGLVGYPKYTRSGLDIVTLFNPQIEFGGQIQLESSVKGANGTFNVTRVVHNLESQNPGGNWFTAISVVDPVIFQGGQFST